VSYILGGLTSLAIAIPTFLLGVRLLSDVPRLAGKERTTALLGSLTGFTYFVAYAVWGIRSLAVGPMAGTAAVIPWTLVHGVFIGFGAFFLLYWAIMATHPDFFSKRKWLVILPVIWTGLYTVITAIGTLQATDTIVMAFVTDIGVDIATPVGLMFSLVTMIGWVFYMCLPAPLGYYLFYRRNKGTRGARNALALSLTFVVQALTVLGVMMLRSSASSGYEGIMLNIVVAVAWFAVYYEYRLSGGIWQDGAA
jgi:hypothetical protein